MATRVLVATLNTFPQRICIWWVSFVVHLYIFSHRIFVIEYNPGLTHWKLVKYSLQPNGSSTLILFIISCTMRLIFVFHFYFHFFHSFFGILDVKQSGRLSSASSFLTSLVRPFVSFTSWAICICLVKVFSSRWRIWFMKMSFRMYCISYTLSSLLQLPKSGQHLV